MNIEVGAANFLKLMNIEVGEFSSQLLSADEYGSRPNVVRSTSLIPNIFIRQK